MKFRTLNGPNVYHHKPVLVATIDLMDLADTSSEMLPEFTDRLLAKVPGLESHRCSLGYIGGFVERLRRGTYFAHIIEHVALELSGAAGVEVGFGKARYAGSPGVYDIIVRFKVAEAMESLVETAMELVEALARGQDYDLTASLAKARELAVDYDLGPSTRAVVNAAEVRNIPWLRLNNRNLIQFGYGKNRKLIQATISSQSSHLAVEIACDKELTKTLLRTVSIRVPEGSVVRSEDAAAAAFARMGGAVVVKPLDGNQGKGVSLDLRTENAVRAAFRLAQEYANSVIVEECFRGNDYRILVVNGKMVAAAHRSPAHVIGDGTHTLAELIESENRNPLRGDGHEKPLTRIKIDEISRNFLTAAGIALDHVPAAGNTVFLRGTANLSTGGSAADVTDEVHPEIRSACERAAQVLGLDICGIDYVIGDIAAAPRGQAGGIIEANAAPGIRMHHFPSSGKPRDAGAAIVDMLYPAGGVSSRIPILSVTGTNGKTTTTRLLAHLVQQSGKRVGMTSTDGIFVDGQQVAYGDTTGPASARTVLCDPTVEVAVLETARGGIVRRGLGYDWSDVAVLTNIQVDHIGQDGIEGVEDLLRIKGIVAERVREGGTVVVNAEDALLCEFVASDVMREIPRQTVFFSLTPDLPVLHRHLAEGGRAFYLKNEILTEAVGADGGVEEFPIITAHEIPLTLGGTARFHVANALAACAAARAQGVTIASLRQSLATFRPGAQNRGRTNIYRVKQGYAIIDYGHNEGAFRAMTEMTSRWRATRVTGVLAVPGDRSDRIFTDCARQIVRGFDRAIIREDVDLRGRASGEAARLLQRELEAQLQKPGFHCDVELEEGAAVRKALNEMLPGEVIMLFYDKFELAEALLREAGAEPIAELPPEICGVAPAPAPETRPLRSSRESGFQTAGIRAS